MKLYKREIKPYIQPPQLQGFNDKAFPVEGYDWVSEDLEDRLINEIEVKDPWSKLFFRVRYVEFTDITFKVGDIVWVYDFMWGIIPCEVDRLYHCRAGKDGGCTFDMDFSELDIGDVIFATREEAELMWPSANTIMQVKDLYLD